MSTLDPAMARAAAATEAELDRLLPAPGGPQTRLHEAMRYAALGGGKRLRPFLVAATGQLFEVPEAALVRAGAAVELIHCYSLVHDDLPAMDDAALRRGRPTCHKAFDEATAILAGDALQALAFEVLARADYPADPEQRAKLVLALARAAGAVGMCGGQMIDLEAERQALTLPEIRVLQRLKTGAIIAFACEAGAILGRAGPEQCQALLGYADDLGLAFQITDDLLDLTSDTATLGKDAGRDAVAGKATFVSLLGEAGAREELALLSAKAMQRLDNFGAEASPLRELFTFVLNRKS